MSLPKDLYEALKALYQSGQRVEVRILMASGTVAYSVTPVGFQASGNGRRLAYLPTATGVLVREVLTSR